MSDTLADAGHPVPLMPMGYQCAAHRHQEYVPIESHHIHPVGMGGADVPGNRVKVCANAHYATHEFIRQLMLHAGAVPWVIAQHYGPKVRDLATRGWQEAGRPVHGGGGE
jgi:hypothetical protein